MARERVQVQGIGDVAPGIQPTIQRGVQYAVTVQRAGRNKLMDLADALGEVNPILQSYGQIQQIQYEKGAERGEMEAATADLETAIEGLDKTGEELVSQGLMPRSQLVGYQRAYKRRIGQRQARTLYFKSLNDRLQEVTQDLESDEDIVGNIIADERNKVLQQLGQSPLAMQGFADYSDSVENNFYNNATKKRDRAVQDYNEGMIIEDFNQDFGELLTAADDPQDIAELQLTMKSRMDEIAEDGRIPRSRVVELFWNGFAVPNVNNLLVGENPQPDKAEKMLDSMLDIDLTGKGGRLGNINREGAYIRSKSVELRSRIESARRAVEEDEGLRAKDIIDLYKPAAIAVAGGLTGDIDLDALQQGAVVDFLRDAGLSEEEAIQEASQLIRSQDLNRLSTLGLNYRFDDAKRGAWNAASSSILTFQTSLIQKSQMVLPKAVAEKVIADITDRLEDDADADVDDMLMTGMGTGAPITDVRVKAEANRLSLQAKENIWFENTDAKENYDRELSKALDSVIDVELVESFDEALETAAQRTEIKAEGRTRFEEEYKNKLRSLQRSLVNNPDRDAEIVRQIPELQKKLTEKWKNFKTLELEFEQGRLKEMMEEEEPPTFPQFPDLEQAKENIDDVLNSWWDGALLQTTSSLFFTGEIGEGLRGLAKRQELKEKLITADIPINAKDRTIAFTQADYIQEQIKEGAEYEGNTDLIEGLFTLRQFYGYRNPSEIKPEDASELDFRFTPMYESEAALLTESTQAWREITTYQKSPETLDIDEFPVYKLYNETFGINTVQQLQAFVNTQKAVLKTKNQ